MNEMTVTLFLRKRSLGHPAKPTTRPSSEEGTKQAQEGNKHEMMKRVDSSLS